MPTDNSRAQEQLKAIWQIWRKGDLQAAAAACQALNRAYPNFADGWHASSVVALRLGSAPQAAQFIDRALALGSARTAWQIQRVRCLQAAGERDAATDLFEELRADPPTDATTLAELAVLAGELGRHEAAAGLFERVVDLEPSQARHHYNLAATRRYLGDLAGALESVNQALELDPADADAHYLRSSLRRWTPETHHVEAMKTTLSQVTGQPIAEAQLCFALAKELEDCGEFETSFEWLERGARVRRAYLDYSLEEDLEFIRALEETYDRDLLRADKSDCAETGPLFVVGLPRTGTTLIERILAACDGVTSIGESTLFTRLVAGGAQQANPSPRATRADLVRATARLDFRQLGLAYLQHARPAGNGAARFVDKFPQNSLNIGAIHRALPEAPIILLERHPMDACYAMYKALFTDIYGFSYDLDELGRYFVAHQRLMEHWRACLPERIHVVRYEALVTRTEEVARGLLAYCGLPWQPECLDFQQNPQASTTASASQVRQGIYTTSVGLWKHYRKQLEPLERILREAGCLEGWPD